VSVEILRDVEGPGRVGVTWTRGAVEEGERGGQRARNGRDDAWCLRRQWIHTCELSAEAS